MKKDLLQSLKIIILGLVFCFGTSYLFAAWINPPANPPSSNIDAPINIGTGEQAKGTGDKVAGSLLNINGVLSSNSLVVFGPATVSGSVKVISLADAGAFTWSTGERSICVDALGVLVACPPLTFPTVVTSTAFGVSNTSAKSGGDVTSEGGPGSVVTERGVVWNTGATLPTISTSSKTVDGSGAGVFTSIMSPLISSTTYNMRAYATTNANVTVYGENKIFSTTATPTTLPTIATVAPSNITGNTASSGGTITAGSASITIIEKGLQISSDNGFTFNNMPFLGGTGTTSFVTNLTGLTVNTSYTVKAYMITNNSGTIYGLPITFTTIGGATCGGYNYNNYCWYMASAGQSCSTFCASKGGCNTTDWNDTSSCTIMKNFFPKSNSCQMGPSYTNYFPAVWIYGSGDGGWVRYSTVPQNCSVSNGQYQRLCACLQ
jgi:hypothetical protein